MSMITEMRYQNERAEHGTLGKRLCEKNIFCCVESDFITDAGIWEVDKYEIIVLQSSSPNVSRLALRKLSWSGK